MDHNRSFLIGVVAIFLLVIGCIYLPIGISEQVQSDRYNNTICNITDNRVIRDSRTYVLECEYTSYPYQDWIAVENSDLEKALVFLANTKYRIGTQIECYIRNDTIYLKRDYHDGEDYIIAGTVLIICALGLFGYLRYRE